MSFTAELRQAVQGVSGLIVNRPGALTTFAATPDAFWRAFWGAYIPASLLWIVPAPLFYIEALGTIALTVAMAQLVGMLVTAHALVKIAEKQVPTLDPARLIIPLMWLSVAMDIGQSVLSFLNFGDDVHLVLAISVAAVCAVGGWRVLMLGLKADGWVALFLLIALALLDGLMAALSLMIVRLV